MLVQRLQTKLINPVLRGLNYWARLILLLTLFATSVNAMAASAPEELRGAWLEHDRSGRVVARLEFISEFVVQYQALANNETDDEQTFMLGSYLYNARKKTITMTFSFPDKNTPLKKQARITLGGQTAISNTAPDTATGNELKVGETLLCRPSECQSIPLTEHHRR